MTIDKDVLQKELSYLQVFLIDFMTQMTLNDVPTRKAVLGAFYERLRENTDAVDAHLASRFDDYLVAANSPHPELGRGWSIGKAFAKLCKAEDHALVIHVGARFHHAAALTLAEFIRSQKLA